MEVASNTIIERNDELAATRGVVKEREQTISDLEAKIEELKRQIEDALNNGAMGEEKLRAEIKRLQEEIEQLKIKMRKEYQDMEAKLNK